jgi:hypothetical protein
MKTFKLTVTEDELKALIEYHARFMCYGGNSIINPLNTETSERIHTLTKRLNKETPEIENDPRPQETTPQSTQETASTEQAKIPEGW